MTIYTDLRWLPLPPSDFSAQVRAAADSEKPLGPALRRLAGHGLNINQLTRLAKCVGAAVIQKRDLAPLVPFRLGILSNATTALITPALVGTALRFGIALEVIEAPFNQMAQEAMQPDSVLAKARPDAVLVAADLRALNLSACVGDRQTAESRVATSIQYLQMIRTGIRENTNATVILQTIARLPEPIFGSLDLRLPGTDRWLINRFNTTLADTMANEDILLDVAGIAETVGLENWHDPTQWNIAKLPFAQDLVPLYAESVVRLIGALRGKSRRCLVLDLDNTVWGGVIGDDGLDGIVLGQGNATGEAYLSVQSAALSLREKGIVLAVSSKNDDTIARRPFLEHADMLLRENHVSVFQANWNDKATNIKAIAQQLSLGLESLAFLDDNPAERGLIRRELPDVAVPELPADPALYIRTMLAAGYFESISFSEDDRNRANFYQDNALRVALQSQATNIGDYLASLQMVITFQPFDAIGRSRIAQLISKSNQFNLTTRRYSEAEVAALEADPAIFTLQVRLSDIFGDNGMISVIVCRKETDAWMLDTWLMSCRVLGRGVEEAVIQEILRQARQSDVSHLIGQYIPTQRNGMVADHYSKLGFELIETRSDGETIWRLPVDEKPRSPVTMRIVCA